MKAIIHIVSLVFFASVSQIAFSYEEFCEFDNGKDITFKKTEVDRKDFMLHMNFPRAERGYLHRLDFRYGNPKKYGSHEIYTELAFEEEANGYEAVVHLSSEHKPLVIIAIYHFQSCYSELNLFVENGKVSVER